MEDDGLRVRILVIDRGFVLVGRCPDPETVALWLPVTDCRIVRTWGTTRGLAELCGGPRGGTVLDALAVRETVPVRAILRVLDVEQDKWLPHLRPSSPAVTTETSRSSRTGSRNAASAR